MKSYKEFLVESEEAKKPRFDFINKIPKKDLRDLLKRIEKYNNYRDEISTYGADYTSSRKIASCDRIEEGVKKKLIELGASTQRDSKGNKESENVFYELARLQRVGFTV